MKTPTRHLALALVVFASTILPVGAHAQTGASAPPKIDDVPRETQIGAGKPPEGAPGNGRYTPPMPARSGLPTLWLIGDSTVRNGTTGDNGPDGQWGWGAPITAYFDLNKINVVNRAFGGTSSRTFYNGFFWKDLQPRIRKGDFVMMQFGANDNGGAKGKGALGGIDETTEMNNEETVHTFGWYLRQYVEATRAAGATPIICSLTPRKGWTEDGKFKRGGNHVGWAEQVAKDTNTLFLPLNDIIGQKYEALGTGKVDTLYVPSPKENLHTGWDGAVVNAECVIAGLKAFPSDPLVNFYSTRAQDVTPAKP